MSTRPRLYWPSDENDNEFNMAMATQPRTLDRTPRSAEDGPLESLDASPFKPLGLEFGERPKADYYFVPFKTVQKYPHLFVGKANKDQVAQFFRDTLLKDRVWDFFSQQDPSTAREPLILVPTTQFKQYLNVVNSRLQKELTIPRGGAKGRFFLSFGELDTPRPRYLGRANSAAALDALKKRGFTLPPEDLSQLPFNSAQLFREKMEEIYRSLKMGTSKDPEKLRQKRLERQKGWSRMFKRVQRYLGLRQAISHVSVSYSAPANTIWDGTKPVPFKARESVRFVCVDVEAWERSHSLVTEVGLAILDTEDIEDTTPGKNGENWFSSIEAHHFRIKERRHLVNRAFVKGCPEAFDFGKSEIVSLKNIDKVVGRIIGDRESEDTRPVILVGHDIAQDLKYLKMIGYNHWHVPHIVDEVDTKDMHQRMNRSFNGRGLSGVCSELGIDGRNYHNAGNDAVYTLQAMIAMAIKHTAKGSDKKASLTPGNDDWSDGDMDDGGLPQRSTPPVEEEQTRRPRDNFQNVRW